VTEIKKPNTITYRYGLELLPTDVTKKEILSFFHLDQRDIQFINQKARLYPYRIAMAIQIGSYRFIGRLQNFIDNTPAPIVNYLYRILNIDAHKYPFEYSDRIKTLSDHNKTVKEYLKIKNFPATCQQMIINYLVDQAPDPGHYPSWIRLAENYLRSNNYILPPNKALGRIILSARRNGLNSIIDQLWSQFTTETKCNLDKLLSNETDQGWNKYTNKRFYKASSKKVTEVLNSINDIRKLNLNSISFEGIHKNYIKFFAQRGIQMSSKQLNDQSEKSRYVLMVITLRNLLVELTDISIQMNDEIVSEVFLKGETKSNDHFRKNKKTVKSILSAFHFMSGTLMDGELSDSDKLKVIKEKIPEDKMEELNSKSATLNIPRGTEKLYFASNSYQKVQKYLPYLIETFKMSSVIKNDPLIEAAEYYLQRKNEGIGGIGEDAPIDFINRESWKKVILDNDNKPRTKPWIVCLADCLRNSLRKGSINIDGTKQYKSLESDLLEWKEFKKQNISKDKNLPYTSTAQIVINSMGKAIQDLSGKEDEWKRNLTANIDYEGKIHFRRLDKLEVPESVQKLRNILYKNLIKRPFADVLIETDKFTGYTSQFTRLSSGLPIKSTETKLGCALYSIIYAAACNIPLTKMSASTGIPLDFLANLRDEVLRPQTIQAAIATLVDFYSRLPMAQILGSGETSSSDGQGVLAEGNPLGARFNRKFFKKGTRGFIIYTHILDNYAPFFTQLFPAGPREAPYVADGLLYSNISLIPREHYTDTHGYTDIVFGVLYLLGFRFSPRIANIPDISLWYLKDIEPGRKDVFDNSISFSSIANQWESMQRVIHTIYSGQTRASQIIRKLSAFSARHPLHKAFTHLGRLCKTRHIFEMAGDMNFRRNILQGLNKGESRNAFSNEIRFGSRGIFKEKDPELRLCMASATNLTILCAAICNTIEIQKNIRRLRAEGMIITEEELKFLSPFPHLQYNFIGRINFNPRPVINKSEIEKQFKPLF